MNSWESSRARIACGLSGVLLYACGGLAEAPELSNRAQPYRSAAARHSFRHHAGGERRLPSSSGANGWASVYPEAAYPEGSTAETHGGALADAAHVYRVADRSALVQALYPDAVINADGSFQSVLGADPTPKIIYVTGAIDLSVDASLQPRGYDEYKTPEFDFQSYVAAYAPRVWNIDPNNWNAATNRPNRPSGPLETARAASAARQRSVIRIALGSNTSLLGVGKHARLRHGNFVIGQGIENVVVRNLTFEDAFDHFPAWDPQDSFSFDLAQPGCQAVYDATSDSGPHQCSGGRWNSNYDSISVSGGRHVWIDHCTFNDGDRNDAQFPSVFAEPHTGHGYEVQHHDGTVDVTGSSDFVTLSFNHFQDHDKTNLLGGSDTVSAANGWGALSVTVHHNFYENTGQRMPRVRLGKVHVYDNYLTGTVSASGEGGFQYGIGIGYLAKIYSENNVFELDGAELIDERFMTRNFYRAAPTSGTGLDVGQETYFYDAGSLLNGVPRDLFAAANAAAVSEARPPVLDTRALWQPSGDYAYALEDARKVKARVLREAGAGRL